MTEKQLALEACDSVQTAHVTKAVSVYMDAFLAAEGQANADAVRKAAGDRFRTGLAVLKTAHGSSRALVEQVYLQG